MGWIHLFNKKDSMHFNGSPAHQRLSDAMKSTGQFLLNRPVSQSCHTTHPTPSAGGEGGKKRGYRRPYRGFWPVNMRKPSYSRAGRVWLTVVQYWLVKGLERRLTLGRLKACSKGLVLNVMFMQYSEKRDTGIQHTRAVLNTELHKHSTHIHTRTCGGEACRTQYPIGLCILAQKHGESETGRRARPEGGESGWIYLGSLPDILRKRSYRNAGALWLTAIQYWLIRWLVVRFTFGRLKACSRGFLLKVDITWYSKRQKGFNSKRLSGAWLSSGFK